MRPPRSLPDLAVSRLTSCTWQYRNYRIESMGVPNALFAQQLARQKPVLNFTQCSTHCILISLLPVPATRPKTKGNIHPASRCCLLLSLLILGHPTCPFGSSSPCGTVKRELPANLRTACRHFPRRPSFFRTRSLSKASARRSEVYQKLSLHVLLPALLPSVFCLCGTV